WLRVSRRPAVRRPGRDALRRPVRRAPRRRAEPDPARDRAGDGALSMPRVGATAAILLVAICCAARASAGEHERYAESCEAGMSAALPGRRSGEIRTFCQCVVERSVTLGVTAKELAADRRRMRRDPGGAAGGAIRQAANECFDSMVRANSPPA